MTEETRERGRKEGTMKGKREKRQKKERRRKRKRKKEKRKRKIKRKEWGKEEKKKRKEERKEKRTHGKKAATNRGEQGKQWMGVLHHTGCFGGTRSISATSCLTASFVSEKTFDANSSPTSALGSKFITLQCVCVLDACGLRSCNGVVIG